MGGGLVGDDVDLGGLIAVEDEGEDLGGVADESDRERLLVPLRLDDLGQCGVEVGLDLVEVALGLPAVEAGPVDVDDEAGAAVEGDRERLGAAHAAATGGDRQGSCERPVEALAGDRGEGLVGALEDALGGDVDPRAGGHLAVHHQAFGFECAEVLPVRPVADEVGVGDEDARCPFVGARALPRACRTG